MRLQAQVWRASPRDGADDARMPTSPGVVTWMLCGDHDAASQETRGSRTREGCRGAFEKRHQFIQLATLNLGGMVGLIAFPSNTGPYLYTQNKCSNSLKPVGKGLLEDYSVASHVEYH